MDFKEPDLEELIQNDLRTEISKILSQSEIEELEAATAESRDDSNSKKSPFVPENNGNSNYHTAMAMKDESSHSEEEQQLRQNEFDVLDSSSIQDISQQNQISLGHHEISGHFAVGSYADFTREMGHYPVEPNDLQSLTWLTTVDVHALQRLTEQGTVIPREGQPSGQMNQMENLSTSEGQMPVHQSAIQTVPTTHMTTTGNSSNDHHTLEGAQNPHQPTNSTHYNMPIHSTSISDGRCYPVNHPRYQIQSHQSGGSLSRNSYENSSHGSRRYMPLGHHHHHHHPYPPPPYNVNRSGYLHGGSFIHPRYHHQGQQPKTYPKPVYSYSCLIAMALYNSKTGCLPVSEIYSFMMENYPYFKTAPDGWKNSVRHNLSLNKCFEKVEKPSGSQRKGCLWALNPAKIAKMKEEVQKWKRKDPESIRRSMSNPEELDRELEEMRRADEEAARRRMLSLTSHGLTAHSVHGHHQHSAHHSNVMQMHPQTSPSRMSSGAPVSVPTHQNGNHRCPDLHFSTELAQQNFALTLAKSALRATQDTNEVPYDLLFHGHRGPTNSTVNFGCAPNSDAMLNRHGSSTDMVVLTPGGDKPPHFASPCSASPSSSNTSMLGTFVDCAAGFVGDDELDASLADLAVLHESLWNAPVNSHMSQCGDAGDISESHEKLVNIGHGVSEELPMTSPDGQIRLPPVIRMLSSSQSEQPSPGTPEYKSSSEQRVDNFGRDMSHFSNTSIKPVAMIN